MPRQEINLDIPADEGRVIYGAVVSASEFQATLRPPLFRTIAPDPARLETKTLEAHNPELVGLAEMRRRVQRLIERAKRTNVPDYAEYIRQKAKTGEGFTPQIVLWSPTALHTVIDESTGLGAIVIPDEMRLISIDGDTQTAARHLARREFNDMPDVERIKVVILHGIGIEAAQQVFHDANAKGVKVSTSLAIGFDNRDPVTRLVKQIEARTPELSGRVNYQKRQLGKNDPEILTASALRTAVVCFVESISGVVNQTNDIKMPPEASALIEHAALKWFQLVVKTLNGALDKRAVTFATAPAVWAALGAYGNKVLHDLAGDSFEKTVDPTVLDAVFHTAIEQVRVVNWDRGEHWLGSGAKPGKRGVTLGGPKEAGHLVFRALTAPEEPAYLSLRKAA
jgi:DNA sulfur modification protein DndB